jgi:LAO/AO transport system kinase
MSASDASKEQSRKHLIEAVRQRQLFQDVEFVLQGILNGDRGALSQAITWSESTLSHHRTLTENVIAKILPDAGQSFRLGITGVPGVGKSTLIESLGLHWIEEGHKVAVLAIDPSSPISQGSILGDKTRMEQLSMNDHAFIRPTASSNELGGVASRTHEAILLCEAAGFDRIIIETVGVGQSETAVYHMTDCFLLLMLAGAGDQLQGIKRGIMEMCDVMAITKSDGQNLKSAQLAKAEYQNALHLFPERPDQWSPPVLSISAIEKKGITELAQQLARFEEWSKNRLWKQRRSQQLHWQFEQEWLRQLKQKMTQHASLQAAMKNIESKVASQEISISAAVHEMISYLKINGAE